MAVGILFVCLGNICRSPMAEAIFSSLIHNKDLDSYFKVDSAGTCAHHPGGPPHENTVTVLAHHGITTHTLTLNDFSEFDYIICMDNDNVKSVKRMRSNCKSPSKAQVMLFGEFGGSDRKEIEDPWGYPLREYEVIFQKCEKYAQGLLKPCYTLVEEKSFMANLENQTITNLSAEYATASPNIWEAANEGDIETVRNFIQQFSSAVNAQDDFGYSPLAAAAGYEHFELVRFLLSAGADIDIRDIDGETPLFQCESVSMLKLLVDEGGANIMALNKQGRSVLDQAVDEGNMEIALWLHERGVPLDPQKESNMLSYLSGAISDDVEK